MSFQKYLRKHFDQKKISLHDIEFAVSPYKEYPFLRPFVNLIKNYFITRKKNFVNRYLKKYIFSPWASLIQWIPFLKESLPHHQIFEISQNSILIEGNSFKQSLELATHYFKVTQAKQLLWKKVYYSEPEKAKKCDAYKFIRIDKEKDIVQYVMEGDFTSTAVYLPVGIEVTREGKYLCYYATINNKDLAHRFIKYLLMKLNVDPTPKLINKISSQAKKWYRVDDWFPNSLLDARGVIQFEDNFLNAYLKVIHPSKEGKIYDEIDIQKIIDQHKITNGINWDEIKKFLKKKRYDERLLLAQGIAKKDGSDATFEEIYLKEVDTSLAEQGVYLYVVKKGEKIIKKVAATQGKAGLNVFGKVIEAKNGVDINIRTIAGKNTHASRDKQYLIADIDGHVYFYEGLWTVQEVLELEKVDHLSGNINHPGTIIVHGSVYDGYSVTAAANILIKESVGACTLQANGDIEIKLGMSGKKRGKIESNQGNVKAKFLQDTEIHLKKDLIIEKLISGCKIDVGNDVIVTDAKGSIWGSHIEAFGKVEAENIGSVSGRKVFISVGIPQKLRLLINNIKKQAKKKEKEIEDKKEEVINKQNTDLKDLMIKELENLEDQYNEILKKLDNELVKIKKATTAAKVEAKINLFSGVTLQVNHITYENRVLRKQISVVRDPENPETIKMNKVKKKR